MCFTLLIFLVLVRKEKKSQSHNNTRCPPKQSTWLIHDFFRDYLRSKTLNFLYERRHYRLVLVESLRIQFYKEIMKRKPLLYLRVILPSYFEGQTSVYVLLNNDNVSCVFFIVGLAIKFNSMPCYIAILGHKRAHCDWIPRGTLRTPKVISFKNLAASSRKIRDLLRSCTQWLLRFPFKKMGCTETKISLMTHVFAAEIFATRPCCGVYKSFVFEEPILCSF